MIVQDFFAPQPAGRNVSVFLMKQVLHDWSDENSVKFLTRLRAAAQKDTKLLIVESLIQPACRDLNDNDDAVNVSGYVPHEAPAPLLANYGVVNPMGYIADIL
ncbi:hypothetical protein C0993_001850, partial [Termitomyces sp. T159_Od127]